MTVAEYNKCVDDYADRLFRFVVKSVKDQDTANDLVQESYTRLWEKVSEVNAEKVRSYLFTTAYHLIAGNYRKGHRMDFTDDTNTLDAQHNEQYTDIKEVLDNALEQLPKIQKSVILLRDYEGYSYADIAEITKLSEAQVKVYIYRGRMALKQKIGSVETII